MPLGPCAIVYCAWFGASVAPGEGDLMSKAIVKETDDEGDLPDESPAIPPGINNYMTPEGHRRKPPPLITG